MHVNTNGHVDRSIFEDSSDHPDHSGPPGPPLVRLKVNRIAKINSY